MKNVNLRNFSIGGDKLTIFAGPCVIESDEMLVEIATELKSITQELDINFVFKASYDKANRSSIKSFRGPGLREGLASLEKIKEKLDIPLVTDIHLPEQASFAARVVDVIQIPAFLSRQTDILTAAARTGKIVNLKKGQFLAPQQIESIACKIKDSGNENILITERGVSFGYNNLVVDMRAIPIIQRLGYPVVFDATHSVQLPGAAGESSSGEREFVPVLAKSAIAAGADALFFEIHPEPEKALCDGANMIALNNAREIFKICRDIFNLVRTA